MQYLHSYHPLSWLECAKDYPRYFDLFHLCPKLLKSYLNYLMQTDYFKFKKIEIYQNMRNKNDSTSNHNQSLPVLIKQTVEV